MELLNKKETREKQKKMKEFRRKTKHENVFELGVQAKKVWEEVRQFSIVQQDSRYIHFNIE